MNKGGMGLGLTISKMIVQNLGGDISVKSNFGVGTKFTFIIPLLDNPAPPPNGLLLIEEHDDLLVEDGGHGIIQENAEENFT
jgi:hypothetical protein